MAYRSRKLVVVACLLPCFACSLLSQQSAPIQQQLPVHLQVEAGTPLRLYITKRIPYRVGEPVQAKLVEPVWAFDRVVIPAGAAIQGKVVELDPVSKMVRARAIVNGDFTPLKQARVSFTTLSLPDGHTIPLRTERALGMPLLYDPPRPPKKPKKQKASSPNSSRAKQFLSQQARQQVNAQSRGLYDLVRGPSKREWLENFLLSKLPYHPQWYRTRTRFDALLSQTLDFGTVEIGSNEFALSGTPAPPGSVGQMALLATISSSDAHVGDPMQGLLSQPLFTPQHKLLLPQGTRFTGRITLAHRARMFHRGGKLRFVIEQVDVPENGAAQGLAVTSRQGRQPVQGQLMSVEADPKAVKVDSEGTATATESKTRLLRPAIAALIAAKSLDNDAGKQTASGTGAPNTAGRSLGGFSGFGLLGIAAARGPSSVGAALGFYGLAWSVYSNIISRGSEVTFEKNTAIAIQFGTARK
jgi:hypothetical protein